MVCADSDDRLLDSDSMAMGLERSKPLHNFTLPFLKWGNQRYLRCTKLDSGDGDGDGDGTGTGEAHRAADRRSPAVKFNFRERERGRERERPVMFKDSGKRLRGSKSKIERTHDNYEGDEGIAAVREKLMIDLKTAADKMKVAFWRDGVVGGDDDDDEDEPPEKEFPAVPTPAEELRPWSLRVRRAAAAKAPVVDAITGGKGGGGGRALKVEKKGDSPLRSGDVGDGGGGARSSPPGWRVGSEKKEREKFSVALSKKEIEEDFAAMMGRRPPRRPKKRPRIVQNQMDTLFPGLWLSEITADLYDVPEIPKNSKR